MLAMLINNLQHATGTANVVTSHGGSAKRNVIGCPSANQNY
jgi:hypothetical protein